MRSIVTEGACGRSVSPFRPPPIQFKLSFEL